MLRVPLDLGGQLLKSFPVLRVPLDVGGRLFKSFPVLRVPLDAAHATHGSFTADLHLKKERKSIRSENNPDSKRTRVDAGQISVQRQMNIGPNVGEFIDPETAFSHRLDKITIIYREANFCF